MPKHPIQGMKGSKPRLREAEDPVTTARSKFEANSRLDQAYKEKRNALLDVKYKREAMALALERETLIRKDLARQQLSYMLIAARQKLLSIAPKFGNRFGGGETVEVAQAVQYLEREIHDVLNELKNLPLAVEPDWMEKVEEDEA